MNGEAGKREKLIRAAMELFAEDGYDKVSIRQIAAAAGVNSSMISYYFNGKNGLYEAIVKELLQNFDSFIGSVRAEEVEPREGLRLYVQTISRLYAKYPPSFVKLVYRELLNPSEIFEQVAVGRSGLVPHRFGQRQNADDVYFVHQPVLFGAADLHKNYRAGRYLYAGVFRAGG